MSSACWSSATYRWVRDRTALINGTAEATMTGDEGGLFLMLGGCLEGPDMTQRLVATAAAAGEASRSNTLRACGAQEAFLRTYDMQDRSTFEEGPS